jgi:YVTN family beta-propeller protein
LESIILFSGQQHSVGNTPSKIGVNEETNTIYVANLEDGTVTVIDEKANKVVTKVPFNIKPSNSGHIECDKDKLIDPLSQQFYSYSNAECIVKPNQDFEFVSWQENLNGNSTQLIKFAPPSSLLDSVMDFYI